jgi:hypothetical protein
MTRYTTFIAVLIAAVLMIPAMAEEKAEQPKTAAAKSSDNVENVVVLGKNVCLACDLGRQMGVEKSCDLYGCRHAFRVESARTPEGKSIKHMEGWVLHYLYDKQGLGRLLAESDNFHFKPVGLVGRVYKKERVIQVSFLNRNPPIEVLKERVVAEEEPAEKTRGAESPQTAEPAKEGS